MLRLKCLHRVFWVEAWLTYSARCTNPIVTATVACSELARFLSFMCRDYEGFTFIFHFNDWVILFSFFLRPRTFNTITDPSLWPARPEFPCDLCLGSVPLVIWALWLLLSKQQLTAPTCSKQSNFEANLCHRTPGLSCSLAFGVNMASQALCPLWVYLAPVAFKIAYFLILTRKVCSWEELFMTVCHAFPNLFYLFLVICLSNCPVCVSLL